ncbi:hypothetical protein ACGFZL_30855 [Streptomyces sp. NPDC048182]|uniref:hypothetical protein n=1 Tax=Streptomyces sp. NPDC048182 TaxID=3365507 RepID=UPI0037117B35
MPKATLAAVALLGAVSAMASMTGATADRPDGARPAAASATGWQQVGRDMKSGVSGIAVDPGPGGARRFLVVRDNKRPGENRLARVTPAAGRGRTPAVEPLDWRGGAEPVDLEALAAVPGAPDEYLALASRGLVYHLKVGEAGAVEVLDLSPLPAIAAGDNFESLALVSRHGRTAAVWADRGAGAGRPATLSAAPLAFDAYGAPVFGTVTHAVFRASSPRGNIRHASDITVTGTGRLLIASAADEGDDGPFASSVSDAGRVSVDRSGRVRLSTASPRLLKTYPADKIEALSCMAGSGTAVLGTDNENAGGGVGIARLCD